MGGALAEVENFPAPNRAEPRDLTREYVGVQGVWSSRIGQVVSNFTDDLEYLVGIDVYERMSKDPTVSKNIQIQKLSVVAEGIDLSPAINDKEHPEFALAHDIKEFHERSLKNLHRPVSQIIGEMMAALKRAHIVAEITYRDPVTTGPDALKLLLKSIKVKPRNTTAFVMDAYRNVLGLTAWVYGGVHKVDGTNIDDNKIFPLEKFAILSFETEDEDPRGINPLRPAYNFWQGKCLVPGLHLKWLEKSGLPSTVGFTAENAPDELDPDGSGDQAGRSAQEVMADTLAGLESGSSAAFPNGATVEQIEVAGNGSQFTRGYNDFDQQIDYALSGQSGATKDSQIGNYSSKRILKGVLDILIWSRKQAVAQVFQKILCDGTKYNFGEDKIHLTPKVSIGDDEGLDWSADATAAANLAPYLTDSQWDTLCQEIGIAAPLEGEDRPSRKKVSTSPNGAGNENPEDMPPPPPGKVAPGQDQKQGARA
jgi:hypothetical protein